MGSFKCRKIAERKHVSTVLVKNHFQNQLIDSCWCLPCSDHYDPWRVRKPRNAKGFQKSWLFETSRLPFEKYADDFSSWLNQCSCVFGSIRFAILLGESKKTKMAILNDSFMINALLGFIKCHNHFPPAILSLNFPTKDPTLNSLAGGWWWCLPKPGAIDQRVRWNSVSWSIFEGEKHWLPCTSPSQLNGWTHNRWGLGQCFSFSVWGAFSGSKAVHFLGCKSKTIEIHRFGELEINQNWGFYDWVGGLTSRVV